MSSSSTSNNLGDEFANASVTPLNDQTEPRHVYKAKDLIQRNTGLLLIILSQCFFSFMNVAVKKLNSLDPPVPTTELIAVRMGITGLFSLLYMIATRVDHPVLGPKGVRLMLLLRGSSGFIGLFGIYSSLQNLSLSDATVLTFLVPICAIFTGALFLGESFSRRSLFAAFVSLIGVVLIARPTFLFDSVPHNDPADNLPRLIAVGMALLGVVGATTAFTTIRAIGKRAHPMQAMLYFSVACVLGSTTGMIITRTPIVVPTRLEWLFLLIAIGIFGFLAQLFITLGFQYETLGRGSMAFYTQIVFASILEFIFFHTFPTSLSAIGIILISCSAVYIALTKRGLADKSTGPIRLPEDGDSIEEGLVGRRAENAVVS